MHSSETSGTVDLHTSACDLRAR